MLRVVTFFVMICLQAWPVWAADDARFEAISIPGTAGITGLLASPAGGGKHAGVILVHDTAGITAHTRNLARRLAAQGYVALAMDFGGDPAKLAATPWKQTVADLRAAFAFLAARKDANGKIGALGFGWGGTSVNNLALAEPKLAAAAGYYGLQPIYYQEDDYRAIDAALLQHYAGRDIMTNQGIDTLEFDLHDVGKSMESYVYPRVDRGFDDESSAAYNNTAAELAWRRTLAFFKKQLGK